MLSHTLISVFFCLFSSCIISSVARTRPLSIVTSTSGTSQGRSVELYSTSTIAANVNGLRAEKINCSDSSFNACIQEVLDQLQSEFPTNLNQSMEECRLFYKSVDCVNNFTSNCALSEKRRSGLRRKVQPALALFSKLCGESDTRERYYMQGMCFIEAKEGLDRCAQNYRRKSRLFSAQDCCIAEELLNCIEAAILSKGCGMEAVWVAKENAVILLGMDPSMKAHSCGQPCVDPFRSSSVRWLHRLHVPIAAEIVVILLAFFSK